MFLSKKRHKVDTFLNEKQEARVPMKRKALRMKELKLQPAALMLASFPAPLFLRERQQNRMASPIIIWKHNHLTVRCLHTDGSQTISIEDDYNLVSVLFKLCVLFNKYNLSCT